MMSKTPVTKRFVHEMFSQTAAKYPEADAVIIGDRRITYGELEKLSSSLAVILQQRGIGPESRVGLYLDRSIELTVAIMATLKAGGVYVPLDVQAPEDRIRWMLEDCSTDIVLTLEQHRNSVPEGAWESLVLDGDSGALAAASALQDTASPGNSVPSSLTPDNLAYIIYTSGSTGRPKGVMITHAGIMTCTEARELFYALPRVESMFIPFSFTFDGSVASFWFALTLGASVLLPEPERATDIGYLVDTVRKHQPTHADILTTIYDLMIDYASDEDPAALDSLKCVIVGAEVLPPGLVARHYNLLPDCLLYNEYGPTESTVWATTYLTQPGDEKLASIPIGKPSRHITPYILDDNLEPVEDRGIGTLWLGGPGVARGYQNLEEQTSQVFIPHPTVAGERIYNTGDLVWIDEDTENVMYVGRRDHQVKVRGVRIELSEIENVISSISEVGRTAVNVRKVRGADHLVAYVEPRGGASLSEADVDAKLKETLPSALVPSYIVIMSELPSLTSGKVDRQALNDITLPEREVSFIMPATSTEGQIQKIWQTVLKAHEIGTTENFFSLGGHSLLATQIISRIRKEMGVVLQMRALFSAPTIVELSALVDEQLAMKAGKSPAASSTQLSDAEARSIIKPQPRLENMPSIFPTTSTQAGMWFLQNFAPQGTAYNMPFALHIRGQVNRGALQIAFNALVEKHEAYRTSFSLVNGEPMMIVAPAGDGVVIEQISLRDLPPATRIAEAQRIARDRSQIPFDLTVAPLFRVYLIELDDTQSVLLTVTHHLIGDQWSDTVLFKDLSSFYNAAVTGKPVAINRPAIDFADYAVWNRDQLTGDKLKEHLDFWLDRVRDLVPGEVPPDFPRPARQSFKGGQVSEVLSERFTAQVQEWSSNHGVTPFMTLLGAYMVLIARYSAQYDISVGAPIATRNHSDTESVVGALVNPLVMRADLTGDPTFLEVINRIRDTTLDAFAHQDLPFERLVEAVGGAREIGSSPMVRTQFNMVTSPIDRLELDDLKVDQFDFDAGSAIADFGMTVDPHLFRRIGIEYSSDLYEKETVTSFLRHYLILVDQVITNPDKRISEYSIVTAAERKQLLTDWNPVEADIPDVRVSDLIAAQSLREPDRIAIRMEDAQLTYSDLTYGELTDRSNQYAHFFRARGVQKGGLVGVCLQRSPEMVAVLLGIMKAGGAYVPLDPAFPRERLRLMVGASNLKCIVTTSDLLSLVESAEPTPHAGSPSVLLIDESRDDINTHSTWAIESDSDAADLAYVLFTSGSTGTPKGVEITHRSLVNFLLSMKEEPGFTNDDRLLAITTLSFDIAALELFLPLVSGGSVILASREQASDGRLLNELFVRTSPTVMQATPSTWRMLLDSGWEGSSDVKVLCGGEPLPTDLAARILSRCAQLWNVYGPTETTVWSTVELIGERGGTVQSPVSIGKPIRNTTVYVLDSQQQLVPPGVVGELYIGGEGLSNGYHGRPDLTAEQFVQNPFGAGLIYKTGDSARWLKDGRLEHLGRLDHQVKIRGFRIELGEIEGALALHPDVSQAVVTTRANAKGEQSLVAYIVFKKANGAADAVPANELRQYISDKLPAYMMPSRFVAMESLPMTANNKVDMKALPQIDEVGESSVATGLRPTDLDPLELQLLLLYRQVLGVESMTVDDNFFELGGHSLTAIQLLTQVNKVIGKELPLATLFQAPSVAQMARLLMDDGFEPSWRSLVAINAGGYRPPIFAVPGVGGNVLMFAKIARLLGSDQPFYGLQARGLDGKTKPFATIQEAAMHNVQEVRTVYPNGPYRLLGVCTGGVIAYEMAQILEASGEKVELILADTWHPTSYQRSRLPAPIVNVFRPISFIASKLAGYVDELLDTPVRRWPSYMVGKLSRAGTVFSNGRMDDVLLDGRYFQDQVADATFNAISLYDVRDYNGALLYIVATERPLKDNSKDTRLLWKKAARGPNVKAQVPAIDSGQLFVSPHVETVKEVISSYLRGRE